MERIDVEQRTLRVTGRLGLHARAAANLVRIASQFHSTITLQRLDNSVEADAKSILSILMLAASRGTELRVTAEGEDAPAALNAVLDLFARDFDEPPRPVHVSGSGAAKAHQQLGQHARPQRQDCQSRAEVRPVSHRFSQRDRLRGRRRRHRTLAAPGQARHARQQPGNLRETGPQRLRFRTLRRQQQSESRHCLHRAVV